MRKGQNELKEIVWEITGQCVNRCEYCGSKDGWLEGIGDLNIIKIAEEIAKYPPKEISVSGGDPTLVSLDIHKKIYHIFKDKAPNMMMKILINPKSFKRQGNEVLDIIKLYEWIGVSINDQKELNIAKGLDSQHPEIDKIFEKKTTFITNFNATNIFLFDEIKKFVKGNPWTIQYTIYGNEDDSKAIYNNDEAVNYLKSKIEEAIKEKVQIMISDDMSGNPCWAGTSVCGITSNGDIVPCLSMRAWADIKTVIQGNILSHPGGLKEVWEKEFQEYRFGCFKCCKDHCKNKAIGEYVNDKDVKAWEDFLEKLRKTKPVEDVIPWTIPYDEPRVVAYAVTPPGIYVYAATRPIHILYGIRPVGQKDDTTTGVIFKTYTTNTTLIDGVTPSIIYTKDGGKNDGKK